jgi:glycosyltransferase involved in cell wall biosynthesis
MRFRPQEKIQVIHLGIAIPDVYKNRHFSFKNLKDKRPVIGTISRLSREKGLERLIYTMPLVIKHLPEANFLIIGEGDEEKTLKNKVNELNLEKKVKFIRIPFGSAIFNGFENIDIFVMPSLREGCPNVLLEALALARPVVASNIEGIKDIIDDGKDGLLVDTSDSVLFAEKLLNLCQNPDKAIALGESGRRKMLSNFSIDHEMQQYKKLYNSILEKERKILT